MLVLVGIAEELQLSNLVIRRGGIPREGGREEGEEGGLIGQ
jgi:hypothetical protein